VEIILSALKREGYHVQVIPPFRPSDW